MPKKRSKSEERERKQRQRENKSEKEKDIIKERDAYRKKHERNQETEDANKQRKALNAERIKKMREKLSNESIEDRRHRLRIKKCIGIENGKEASWIRKSMEEMNIEEKRDYIRKRSKWSRETDSDEKKRKQKMSNRKRKYDTRIVGFHTKRTEDLRTESSFDEHESDESSNTTDEDDFPYWMDYPSDNEELTVVDPEKLIPHDMKAEAALLDKHRKEQIKERLQKPASPLPGRKKCLYEELREENIRQKIKAMGESGLWSADELKVLYPDFEME
jgi:hypothetical protein